MLVRFLGVVCVVSILGLWSDALALNVILLSKPVLKSVECEIVGTGMGNVQKDPVVFACLVGPPQEATTIRGLVVCGAPGKKLNEAPGIQVAEFDGTFAEFDPVDPKNCGKNGKCTQTVHSELSATQLATLNTACPNTNWVAKKFGPCAATVTIQAIGKCSDGTEGALDQRQYNCVIANCEAVVKYNPVTQQFVTDNGTNPAYTCDNGVDLPPTCQ